MQAKVPTLDDVARLVATTARTSEIGECCAELEAILQARYGHRLFTVFRVIEEQGEIERLHSSNTTAYALQGRKKKQDTVWGRVVLDEGKPLISRNPSELRRNFPDYETIADLGIKSMINIPLVWNGRVLGSMNISHVKEGFFEEVDVPYLKMLGGILAPVVTMLS